MKRALLAIPAIAALALCRHHAPEPVRIATFNIENFPKDRRQVDGAFAEIASTHASIVAVQEITDPWLFASTARTRLGASWRFVSQNPSPFDLRPHYLGVAFDSARWQLVGTGRHDDTGLDGRLKATYEVRLRPTDGGGAIVRVLVVHFKSGSAARDLRAQQYLGLDRILGRIAGSGDRVIVLGDFNATEAGDRDDLARISGAHGLDWATEPLACTAFWRRSDGCPRSRLDHVLAWQHPATVEALGACATEGCDWQDRCPVYREHVSDHCPVVVTLSDGVSHN